LSRPLNQVLNLRLTAGRISGWIVSVSPLANEAQDWMYPVNLPLRTGESQYLATGYGTTVKEKLAYAHNLQFVLTENDYARYSKMAASTLAYEDPDAAADTSGRCTKFAPA
jgi:hypothetical protein